MYTFKNNLKSKLLAALTTSSTSLKCAQPKEKSSANDRLALWPSVGNGNYFTLTLEDTVTKEIEIVKVTGITQNLVDSITFTVERGQEGTTPRAFAVNTSVEHRLTAGGIVSLDTPGKTGVIRQRLVVLGWVGLMLVGA